MNNMLMDSYGRVITSLRVSITKKCNLNCIYCHEEGEERNPEREISLDTIVKIVTTATEFGVKKVKFSGGEPLMRNDFEEIIRGLPDLKDISATTNGVLLSKRAASLADRYNGNVILQLIELMNFKNVSQYMIDINSLEKMLESRAALY